MLSFSVASVPNAASLMHSKSELTCFFCITSFCRGRNQITPPFGSNGTCLVLYVDLQSVINLVFITEKYFETLKIHLNTILCLKCFYYLSSFAFIICIKITIFIILLKL